MIDLYLKLKRYILYQNRLDVLILSITDFQVYLLMKSIIYQGINDFSLIIQNIAFLKYIGCQAISKNIIHRNGLQFKNSAHLSCRYILTQEEVNFIQR
ncbi:hypothetical protein FGO68_gene13635 [Halteria grandinella]|uniref:Uncharacterized protein n=1 Tax=Halteria grandinella TaxID=5974 RepID=A0A8J8NB59_HALGN|nr:hypothetical protein FGO68_gene13635 [Halteria grandinella]